MSEKGFLTNESSVRFLDKIISDLDSCESFDFSVSFIKKAGLILMQDAIENTQTECEKKDPRFGSSEYFPFAFYINKVIYELEISFRKPVKKESTFPFKGC